MRQKQALVGDCHQFKKITDIASPCPSLLMTFLDVNPDSICAPCFGVYVAPPGRERIWHYPATYHQGNGVISFADGHVGAHRWTDPRTLGSTLDYHMGPDGHNHASSKNADMVWLQGHATSIIK